MLDYTVVQVFQFCADDSHSSLAWKVADLSSRFPSLLLHLPHYLFLPHFLTEACDTNGLLMNYDSILWACYSNICLFCCHNCSRGTLKGMLLHGACNQQQKLQAVPSNFQQIAQTILPIKRVNGIRSRGGREPVWTIESKGELD